jgi:S-adenosylmethionine:tRNA ribosyltransferase-isomerase
LSQVSDPPNLAAGLRTADFDYPLPKELIAQKPLPRRDDSRLMVLERSAGAIHHSTFRDIGDWLVPGDLFVANNSRVIPARLRGVRLGTGGAVEVLLLRRGADGAWSALAKPAKRLKRGDRVAFSPHATGAGPATAVVEDNLGDGEVLLRFGEQADERLDSYGELPIPPYIGSVPEDVTRYQTVYAAVPGSAAAPTAGMHFTQELIEDLRHKGFGWAEVTLHIGLDTFRPVIADCVADHHIHQEWCEVSVIAAEAIATCRSRGGRVVAVGTTVARTLETLGEIWQDDDPVEFSGFTKTFIVPGHRWKIVDALLTNFHLPRSTLLMLVSALAGKEAIMEAYAEAIRNRYRFYSFGDAMLIR